MLFTLHFKKIVIMGTLFIVLLIFTMGMLSGCKKQDSDTLVIAEQYGLAYAPLQIMQKKGFLEEALGESVEIQWVKMGNTTAIREAMLAEGLDIGFMGIPPFLIGIDQGMPWKIMNGLSESPLGLVTNDPDIETLGDLIDAGKIALPQPGSIQHILLSMSAENTFMESNIFDHQLISMNHPDGYQALLVDDTVVAHYTAPPYLFYELEDENMRLLTSGKEGMNGSFTFIVGVCQETFYENTGQYAAFQEALDASIAFIYDHPEEALDVLSEAYMLDREILRRYLFHDEMIFTKELNGVTRFIDFMYKQDYLNNQWEAEDVIWKNN